MSRLRISDRQSISNLMRQDDPASWLVDRLDIHVRSRATDGDRIQVQMRGSSSSNAPSPPPARSPAPDTDGTPDRHAGRDLSADLPEAGPSRRA